MSVKNKSNIPAWGKRSSFIFTTKHADMLDKLVHRYKQDDPRATKASVLGIAIERLYESYDFNHGE